MLVGMSVDRRPEWHQRASCRGDERWLATPYSIASAEVLRSVCRACPVAGECLKEAMELSADVRSYGVLRVGTMGQKPWRHVDSFVAEFTPVTSADWATVAAWVLDGDAAGLEVVRVRRPWRQNRRPTRLTQRVENAHAGGLLNLREYDPPARAMTRAEIVAARSA